MSNNGDNNSVNDIDEYLGGGSEYSRAYRKVPADEVPSELDRLVLAEAQSAIAATTSSIPKSKMRFWNRVAAPVALAASVVLAVSLMLQPSMKKAAEAPLAPLPSLSESSGMAPPAKREAVDDSRADSQNAASAASDSKVSNEFAKQTAQPSAAPPEVIERREADKSDAESERTRTLVAPAAKIAEESKRKEAAPPEAPAPALADATKPVPAESEQPANLLGTSKSNIASNNVARGAQSANVTPAQMRAQSSGKVAPAPSATPNQKVTQESTLDRVVVTATNRTEQPQDSAMPIEVVSSEDLADVRSKEEQWLQRIRDLRTQGKNLEADREWGRFTRSYPNYPVDANDKARPQITK